MCRILSIDSCELQVRFEPPSHSHFTCVDSLFLSSRPPLPTTVSNTALPEEISEILQFFSMLASHIVCFIFLSALVYRFFFQWAQKIMDFIIRFYQLEKITGTRKIWFVKYSLLIKCTMEQKHTELSWEHIITDTEDLSMGTFISL